MQGVWSVSRGPRSRQITPKIWTPEFLSMETRATLGQHRRRPPHATSCRHAQHPKSEELHDGEPHHISMGHMSQCTSRSARGQQKASYDKHNQAHDNIVHGTQRSTRGQRMASDNTHSLSPKPLGHCMRRESRALCGAGHQTNWSTCTSLAWGLTAARKISANTSMPAAALAAYLRVGTTA